MTPSKLFERPFGSVILKLTFPLSRIVENLKSNFIFWKTTARIYKKYLIEILTRKMDRPLYVHSYAGHHVMIVDN